MPTESRSSGAWTDPALQAVRSEGGHSDRRWHQCHAAEITSKGEVFFGAVLLGRRMTALLALLCRLPRAFAVAGSALLLVALAGCTVGAAPACSLPSDSRCAAVGNARNGSAEWRQRRMLESIRTRVPAWEPSYRAHAGQADANRAIPSS